MIPRPNRPAPGLRPRLDLRIADDVDPLPEWRPRTPAGGWTPASARTAAAHYADDVAATQPDLDPARVARAAHHALLSSVTGLREADLLDRLTISRAAKGEG
ncbi:hypothetical protein [Microbacterium sp.]|uniref:hypothetical protein n=1 Tax=Microbacterium sp. TaxID=51671 RepID=UPI002B74FCC1|nr:hypothetical protein [Microbacterium sp.]HWL78114.1 hypothetical protein [Microbacterium sp.]